MKQITRRNFINVSAAVLGTTALPSSFTSVLAEEGITYPPKLTGLRGNHPGSNTHAHARAWNANFSTGKVTELKESYDLVVVGAGLSGLAAAYFYREQHGPNKKILILDNHDD